MSTEQPKTISARELNRLQQENQRLKALVNAFYFLNSSIDLDAVLSSTLHQACALVRAEIGSIALLNESRDQLVFLESTDPKFDKLRNFSIPIEKGLAGHVARTGQTIRVDDVHKDPRFYGKIDQALEQRTVAYICTPLIVSDTVIGTAQLMNKSDGGTFSADDASLLEGFAHQAALAIHNANMHRIMLKQKASEAEMGICSDIQTALFPSAYLAIEGYQYHGFSRPARQVGGDYYTWLRNRDGSLDIVIADISGKGVSAALMVSEFHTGYHILGQQMLPLDELFNQLNAHLLESLPVGHFITAYGMRIYPDQDEFEYVLAGHSPPIILRDGAEHLLERTGLFLGLERDRYQLGRFQMRSGDLLLAFSDGLPEATNADMELYEEERIIPSLRTVQHEQDLAAIQNKLLADLDVFRQDMPLPDDLTMVLLRRL
ncbi:MAG: SpoIIE family protein phosphatase [Leptospiraceae bacterium]|nr:SpoIIE family protein phosphatase [Leptospiraceae bacterium]